MAGMTTSETREWILSLRKAKRLHTEVENRLIALISGIAPEYHAIREPVGLAGGRNDLMLFEFSGKKVLFEVFATRSQVSRDLRILDKTDADQKIAVIIDKEIDSRVFEKYARQNPEDNYPFIFIGELFAEPPIKCSLKLRELVIGDEDAKFERLLRARISQQDFFRACREEGIQVLCRDDLRTGDITYLKVFVAVVLAKCLKLGVSRPKARNLGRWLSDGDLLKYVLLRCRLGLNLFIYTDFEENFGVHSDIELVDWIRASPRLPQAHHFLLSLNSIIQEIESRYLRLGDDAKTTRELTTYVGGSHVHETPTGRVEIVPLPRDIKSIVLIPPPSGTKAGSEYMDMVQVSMPGSVIHVS